MWIAGKASLSFFVRRSVVMKKKNVSKYFGCMVFDDRVMKGKFIFKSISVIEKNH